jgi:hypothetical protein
MRRTKLAWLLAFAAALVPEGGLAQPAAPDPAGLITPALLDDLRGLLKRDIVQVTVKAQNARLAAIDADAITALDKQWVAERKAPDKPLISATLSNPLSTYLLRMQARSLGLYSEVFIMDAKGLNVGQSSITSDYWQGDEAKWQKTFAVGADAVFVDEPEWHAETKTWRVQVNMAVPDASGGAPLGAATVEIKLTELQRRHAGS